MKYELDQRSLPNGIETLTVTFDNGANTLVMGGIHSVIEGDGRITVKFTDSWVNVGGSKFFTGVVGIASIEDTNGLRDFVPTGGWRQYYKAKFRLDRPPLGHSLSTIVLDTSTGKLADFKNQFKWEEPPRYNALFNAAFK